MKKLLLAILLLLPMLAFAADTGSDAHWVKLGVYTSSGDGTVYIADAATSKNDNGTIFTLLKDVQATDVVYEIMVVNCANYTKQEMVIWKDLKGHMQHGAATPVSPIIPTTVADDVDKHVCGVST